jgi:hypothetical protein
VTLNDILVIAPYNAQVFEIHDAEKTKSEGRGGFGAGSGGVKADWAGLSAAAELNSQETCDFGFAAIARPSPAMTVKSRNWPGGPFHWPYRWAMPGGNPAVFMATSCARTQTETPSQSDDAANDGHGHQHRRDKPYAGFGLDRDDPNAGCEHRRRSPNQNDKSVHGAIVSLRPRRWG